MNQTQWNRSTSGLRKLLYELPMARPSPSGRIRRTSHQFGALYNRRYNFWHIWNCQSENVIATVRFRRNRILVRYRPASRYAYILRNYRWAHLERQRVIAIPSKTLGRHKDWIRDNIHAQTVQRFQEEEQAFLARESELYGMISNSPLEGYTRTMERILNESNGFIQQRARQSGQTGVAQMMEEAYRNMVDRHMIEVATTTSSTSAAGTLSPEEVRTAAEYLRVSVPDLSRWEVRQDIDSLREEVVGWDSLGNAYRVPRWAMTLDGAEPQFGNGFTVN